MPAAQFAPALSALPVPDLSDQPVRNTRFTPEDAAELKGFVLGRFTPQCDADSYPFWVDAVRDWLAEHPGVEPAEAVMLLFAEVRAA